MYFFSSLQSIVLKSTQLKVFRPPSNFTHSARQRSNLCLWAYCGLLLQSCWNFLLSPFTPKSGKANKRHPSLSPLASADQTIPARQMGKRILLTLTAATINPNRATATAVALLNLSRPVQNFCVPILVQLKASWSNIYFYSYSGIRKPAWNVPLCIITERSKM